MITADTLLTSEAGRNIAERILDKEFLKRVQIDGVLYNKKAYALQKPMPTGEGFYFRFTRKQNIRQPSTDPMTNGQSSDPAGGFNLLADQVLLPIESHRDYTDIDVMTPMISWINVETWAKEDMAKIAWPRFAHRLIQAACINGRMTPGVYDSTGAITTGFWQTAATSLTRYGVAFTFDAFPRAYGNNKAAFNQLDSADYLRWDDIRRAAVGMSLGGVPMITSGSKGPGYVFVCSDSTWNDLLMDNDNGNLTAARQGGLEAAIDGLVNQQVFKYAGVYFVIDSDPYTMGGADSVARAQWGDLHCGIMFGQDAYGFTNLGSQKMSNFKITDTSKTGTGFSIGSRVHWNTRVINPNFGKVIIAPTRITKPNNWSPTNTQANGFANT